MRIFILLISFTWSAAVSSATAPQQHVASANQAPQQSQQADKKDQDKPAPQKKEQEPKSTPPPLPEEKPLGAAGPSRVKHAEIEDADFKVINDRWRTGFPSDPRYVEGSIKNPYRQNVLKGDYPVIGQHTFLSVTLASETTFVMRRLPVPQDVSSVNPGSFEFFGRGRQEIAGQNFVYGIDLFHGEASFKPVDWRFKLTGITNINYLRARENGIVNIDVRRGTDRTDDFSTVEDFFFEVRLGDTTKLFPFLRGDGSQKGRSPFFDTTSIRAGLQPFTSDFRGFIFSDANLGVRLFGNFASNRWQYNIAFFDMLEKDTNSELNIINFRRLRFRDQKVFIANVYRQDTFVKGYTTQFSLHYNDDRPSRQFDVNGFLVRPAKIGTIREHKVKVGYLGWAGDGHVGRINVTHAFYQAFGRDDFNQIAGRATHINAQMAAGEFSIDHDWLRYRAGVFYTSGDGHPEDGSARGFDAILDSTSFAGGKFSFWNSQGIRLTQTGVALVEGRSLIPSLRSSKIQGQANFVNPGLTLYNAGIDADLTPKLRGFFNYNYIRLNRTEPVQQVLFQPGIRKEIGHDLGFGFIYRPYLNENVILAGGLAGLQPGRGFTDIYSSNCNGTPTGCGAGRPALWSTFITLKFVY